MDYNQERYVERLIDLKTLLDQKSYFLFGPRQTGKSSLLRHCFPNTKIYDLLDNALFLDLNSRPQRLREELAPNDKLVIIDEIQRVPQLLNEIHFLIEQKKIRFFAHRF
jgi:uncharacterized protein